MVQIACMFSMMFAITFSVT